MLKIHKEFLGSEVKISQQPIKKIEDLSQDELNELFKSNHPAVYLEPKKKNDINE